MLANYVDIHSPISICIYIVHIIYFMIIISLAYIFPHIACGHVLIPKRNTVVISELVAGAVSRRNVPVGSHCVGIEDYPVSSVVHSATLDLSEWVSVKVCCECECGSVSVRVGECECGSVGG